jgi:RNA polymerase sigma factor (sigma-70 family)
MSEAVRRIDPAELRTHVARLRALARHLLADGGQADDVVQDAFVAAIERPPRTGVAIGPWLVGVVRNLVRRQHRTSSRRASHESAAASSAGTPSPDEVAARSEALRDLADAVHRLDPIYRDVIVLRFFDGLRTSAIAARLGVPVETARTRLKRALALLRERLDAEHGGDGRTWCAALLPLAAPGALSGSLTSLPGGLAMTAKTKASIAAAALLVVAVTFSVVLGSGSAPPPVTVAAVRPAPEPLVVVEDRPAPQPEPEPAAAPAPPKPAVAVATPVTETPPAPEPAAPQPVAAEPVGTAALSGAVWFAGTRKPASGLQVLLEAPGATAISTRSDALGRFRFEHLLEDRAWRLRIDAQGFAPVVVPNLYLEHDETRGLGVLWLDAPVPLGVVVKDWRDRPIAGATVEAERYVLVGISDRWDHAASLRHVTEPVAAASTGADGRAVLTTLPPGDWVIVARAAGFAPVREGKGPLVRGAANREVTLRLDRGLAVEGRIVDGDRRPMPRMAVWAVPRNLRTGSYVFQHTSTDGAGRFAFDGLVPGDWAFAVANENLVPSQIAIIRVPASAPVEIVLDGGVVEGVVTGAHDGSPLAGARVLVTVDGWIAETLTGQDGRYRLSTLRAGRPEFFRVQCQGFVTTEETTSNLMGTPKLDWKSGAMTRDFMLRRAVPLSGRVLSPDGPVAGARVVATWADRLENWTPLLRTEGATDEEGRFTLSGVPPTTVVVQAFADGWYQEGLVDFNWSTSLMKGRRIDGAIDVPPGGLADLTISMSRACVVSGRVESAAGLPLAGASVSCNWTTTITRGDGTFTLQAAVIGGSSTVSASGGSGAWTQQTVSLAKGGRVDGVVLRLPRTVRIGGRVTSAAGAAVDGASVEAVLRPAVPQYGVREWTVARLPVDGSGRYEGEFLEQEGRIFVRASAPGFATTVSPETMIETGRATYQADVVLGAPRALAGRVVSSADGRAPVAGARVALLPADWERRSNDSRPRPLAAVTDRDGRFRVEDVSAGDGFIDVDADGFVHAISAIGAPPSGELVLKLDPSFEIAGEVTLPRGSVASDVWDGGVVSGVWVLLRLEHDREFSSWSVATDGEGRFRATGLPRGTYTVSVHVYGGTVSVARFETTGVPAGTTDVAITLSAAGEIAGRVLAPDGRPLGGCTVVAYSESGDPYTPSATTKDDGTFVVRGIGAGTYRLEARPPEPERTGYVTEGAQLRAAKATGVSATAKDVEIRLTGGLSIRGTLFDAAGKPLANTWVRAEPRPGQDLEPGEDAWFRGPGAQTDTAGRFTISGLATARYRLVHVPDPQRIDVARPLKGGDDVAAGASGVRLVAGRASKIAGVVVDEDGNAVASASVTARPEGGGPAVFGQTQADGTFVLDGVSDLARCVVSVSKAEFLDAQTGDVAPGATDVRIRLARGLRATGRILQADGNPFANCVVTLTLDAGEHRVTVVADADGRFTAAGLREGTYRVEVRLSISSGPSARPRSCGTLRAGELDLVLRMTQ